MLPEHTFSTMVGNKELIYKTGKLAEQAGGAVTAQMGDSIVLATATMSKHIREGLVEGGASAALAASIFHFKEYTIAECKEYLKQHGVPARI